MPSEVGTEATRGTRARDPSAHYRPYLDGMRTVAVYLVVAYHCGLGLASGGFIGVDVFFVLSGFLVTQLLVRDLATDGRVRLARFYARRVRRILPAAAVVLICTALVYTAVTSPAESLNALGGFRAAFVYVANWYFIRQSTDYFAVNVNTNPVLHFWSLAVEEQFYLVWPMILAAVFVVSARAGRFRWWVVRMVVVAGGGVSAFVAVHIASTNIDRAYYGTDTRAYQLLAGAALALTPQLLRWRRRGDRLAPWGALTALVLLLVLASSSVNLDPIYRGILAAGLAVTLIVGLENARGGMAKRVLSSPPFTYLGRISYGVYLWHWPVIVVASHDRSLSPLALFAIACPAATALAALSFHLIEHPIRAARALDGFKVPIIAFGLAISIVCGVVVMPAVLDTHSGSISALSGVGVSPSGLKLLDWRKAKNDFPKLPDCLGKPVDVCTVTPGSGLRVVLVGDSNAWMWIPTFTAIAKQRHWDFSVTALPNCPWQRTLQFAYVGVDCPAHQADWYNRVIPRLDPDLVLLAHQAFDNPEHRFVMMADGKGIAPGFSNFEAGLIRATSDALNGLRRPGRKIVILEPIPEPKVGVDPLSCLSLGRPPATCAFRVDPKPTPLELFYRSEGRLPDVTTIDLDHVVCPRWPICDAIVGDIIVRPNAAHVTATFAESVAPQVSALLPR